MTGCKQAVAVPAGWKPERAVGIVAMSGPGGVFAWPEIKLKFAAQGVDVASDTPEQFAAYIKAGILKRGKAIKELGVKSE